MRLPQPNHAYALLWEALTGENEARRGGALLDKRFSSGKSRRNGSWS